MIYMPILQIICIWIAGISATATVVIALAIALAASDNKDNRYTCRIPSCRAHDHIKSDQPSFPQPGKDIDKMDDPRPRDPYLEYGEADVEVLLS